MMKAKKVTWTNAKASNVSMPTMNETNAAASDAPSQLSGPRADLASEAAWRMARTNSHKSASAPTAPIYLLHGHEDTVIPAVESVMLGEYLRSKGTPVRLLLTPLITHAEVDRAAAASDVWNLVSFWAEVLKK